MNCTGNYGNSCYSGYAPSGNRNFPSCLPPNPIPSCCAPVPCSSCCSNPCIPICCPTPCEEKCRPCRPRLNMLCHSPPCCATPCPIFKCCPAPCSSPTIRSNANTTYPVPIPNPPGPSYIVRPKITCPKQSCPSGAQCSLPPSCGIECCPQINFC